MDFNTYQQKAMRTLKDQPDFHKHIQMAVLGLNGESGEVADIIKKHLYHGHDFDKVAFKKELGDVLWYLSTCASVIDTDLNEIAQLNIEKLERRYPNGFNHQDSIHRKDH
ncbi:MULTISPECIES: nucleoside triphosphate pyrophosphohydrolase family protein [Staphylococcus]|uniref:Nucleoside triphosphate pyrophosphohydrolase family protein n=1 Tax=Staphylococcus coagulans TaxID=74706 RepID=A0A9X0PDW0_9STAP|nr:MULTISPECIES: nucleoside triphosphate pyrophosphohydrolase family protein [Staphylococcus]NHA36533.1 nucleotide pyrophosphohydrolase [Staphylococcus schleiferi]MBA8770838.1 nucleoside triphosphate pyrophosphohydrolase family protein [Staphylococcus coagulans]MBA8775856.1 nucleoside triphosphate pyrophosphohydrolase family protein [Staphylococcus coagulans]MBA8778362.1 nucleoside triphosphate pyrophosphohydrolase family protein [Staphylococcus coagulans]NHB71765.1 nucleotide pyrophosphohydro